LNCSFGIVRALCNQLHEERSQQPAEWQPDRLRDYVTVNQKTQHTKLLAAAPREQFFFSYVTKLRVKTLPVKPFATNSQIWSSTYGHEFHNMRVCAMEERPKETMDALLSFL
jgi:hypothetical protein